MIMDIRERCSDIQQFRRLTKHREDETVLFEKKLSGNRCVTYVSIKDKEFANAIAIHLGWNTLHTPIDIANIATCFALSEEHSFVYRALREFRDLFERSTMKSNISTVSSLFEAVRRLERGADKLVIVDMNSIRIDDAPTLIDRLKFCHLLYRGYDEDVTNVLNPLSGIYSTFDCENLSSKISIECKVAHCLPREVISTLIQAFSI
jgi:hypothetical protein|tara:strand:- start:30399 stop:31016 length:618 start_codon:yes stop_codon:yes gene_type:complete